MEEAAETCILNLGRVSKRAALTAIHRLDTGIILAADTLKDNLTPLENADSD